MNEKNLFDKYVRRLRASRRELRKIGASKDLWQTPKNRFVNERIFSQWVHSISQAKSLTEAIRISGLPFDAAGLMLTLLREQGTPSIGVDPHKADLVIHERTSRIIREYSKSRPKHDRELGQQTCSVESLVENALYMRRVLPDSQSKILCVGDDDLLCIPLALLGFDVNVLEIDSRLVRYINTIADAEDFDVRAYDYDIRDPLPSRFVGIHDAFVSNPCVSLGGIKSFVIRGRQGIIAEKGVLGFVHLYPWTLGSYLKPAQEYFLALGFAMVNYQRGFTGYPLTGEAIAYAKDSSRRSMKKKALPPHIAGRIPAEYSDLLTLQLMVPNSRTSSYWMRRRIGWDLYYVGASL